jgi:hypothetical protein
MKTKLLSLASLLAILNANAIEIGPTGSGVEMSGFVDVFYEEVGSVAGDATGAQVEMNFNYSTGPVSAAVGLDFGKYSVYGSGDNLEEAYITYDLGGGFSVTAGKMLTYMGFEAFDAPNMYQFSYAYDVAYRNEVTDAGAQDIYDAHDYGASIDYSADTFSIGVWSSLEQDAGYELALAYTGIDNLTAKAIWSDFGEQGYEKATYWISYSLGKLLLAAEVAEADEQSGASSNQTNLDVDGAMLLANYAYSDTVAITLRYSETEYTAFDSKTMRYDGSKITISPSYVFTDNLAGLIEYSSYDADTVSAGYAEPDETLAVEFIYTF